MANYSFASLIELKKSDIWNWLDEQSCDIVMPIYCSFDIRRSEYKISTIDANAFPSGFNNLSNYGRSLATNNIMSYMSKCYGSVKNIVIISEDHDRNIVYYESLAMLVKILTAANYETRICRVKYDKEWGKEIENRYGYKIYSLQELEEDSFRPDLILNNNDFTNGIDTDLANFLTQYNHAPSLCYGWNNRHKTSFFTEFSKLAKKFAKEFGIDDWAISTYFSKEEAGNFSDENYSYQIANSVELLLEKIRYKYEEYGITRQPKVFIKANNGTYGMGIITVHSSEEVLKLNKNNRKKMVKIKNGVTIDSLILQESIPTVDFVNSYPAEPFSYFFGGNLVGIIHRYNSLQDEVSNLNSRGMEFINQGNIPLENLYKNHILDDTILISLMSQIALARESLVA